MELVADFTLVLVAALTMLALCAAMLWSGAIVRHERFVNVRIHGKRDHAVFEVRIRARYRAAHGDSQFAFCFGTALKGEEN